MKDCRGGCTWSTGRYCRPRLVGIEAREVREMGRYGVRLCSFRATGISLDLSPGDTRFDSDSCTIRQASRQLACPQQDPRVLWTQQKKGPRALWTSRKRTTGTVALERAERAHGAREGTVGDGGRVRAVRGRNRGGTVGSPAGLTGTKGRGRQRWGGCSEPAWPGRGNA